MNDETHGIAEDTRTHSIVKIITAWLWLGKMVTGWRVEANIGLSCLGLMFDVVLLTHPSICRLWLYTSASVFLFSQLTRDKKASVT